MRPASFGGWQMGTGQDVYLSVDSSGDVTFRGPNGYAVVVIQDTDGSFISPTGINATLVENGNGPYTLNYPTNRTDAQGNTLNYTYNANGNRAGLALAYNAKNQTSSATPAGGSAIGMTYTGASQVQRTAAGGTNFVNSLLGQGNVSESGSITYYTRDNQGTLVGRRTSSGRYYYLFNGLGSVLAVTDSSGAVMSTYEYDPWGQVVASNETVANPWQFGGAYGAHTGQTADLIKIGQRYYDQKLGRWAQQDPVDWYTAGMSMKGMAGRCEVDMAGGNR